VSRITEGHALVALDTSIWIYHLQAHAVYQPLATEVLEDVQAARCRAVLSELTLLELLVHPLRLDLQDVADEYEALLTHFPNTRLLPITRPVILTAASVRAKHGIRAPDSLIVATGILAEATLLVTNDKRLKRVSGIEVAYLSDFL
jgi:predicted nucleic acid-binding protein